MSFGISKDVGVDLGTSNIRIFVRGKGIVLDEPCVVAINKITGEVLAAGNSAKEMLGRTPDNIVALKPLKEGVIADFDATTMLLESCINKVVPKSLFSKPRVVVSIPYGITDVEERAVEAVTYAAGAKDVYLIEEVMAASIGCKMKIEKAEGSMIIDIGGGTTEIAVMSLGGIVCSNAIRIGGEKFNQDIVDYARNKYNAALGESDAESIKKQIASADTTMTEDRVIIKVRNIGTGLPEDLNLTTNDISEAIHDSLEKILKCIKLTLEQTPPELAADIMENGVVICGGGSNIMNIDRFLSDELGLPVHIANDPTNAVIRGIGETLDNIEVLKKATKTRKR